jgi:hypothetical protein
LYLPIKLFFSGTHFLLTLYIRLFSHAYLGHFFADSKKSKEYDFVFSAILYRTKKPAPNPSLLEPGHIIQDSQTRNQADDMFITERPITHNMKNEKTGFEAAETMFRLCNASLTQQFLFVINRAIEKGRFLNDYGYRSRLGYDVRPCPVCD